MKRTIDDVRRLFNEKSLNEYTLLSDVYENKRTKMKILCHKCMNIFEMDMDGFLNRGNRCKYCSPYRSYPLTESEFKMRVEQASNNEYTICSEYKNTHSPVTFFHKKCGKSFSMRPNNFLIKGNRCPFCKESEGEKRIEMFLIKNNLSFKREVKAKELFSTKRRFRYDFQVFLKNGDYILIEFDGKQHSEPIGKSEKSRKKFEETTLNDKEKNILASEAGKKLVRISYKNLDQIENILKKTFND